MDERCSCGDDVVCDNCDYDKVYKYMVHNKKNDCELVVVRHYKEDVLLRRDQLPSWYGGKKFKHGIQWSESRAGTVIYFLINNEEMRFIPYPDLRVDEEKFKLGKVQKVEVHAKTNTGDVYSLTSYP